jgi:hypothetical protein
MHPRPWHRDSVFGDGRRAPLDRNQRARFRYLLSAHRRARRLTRAGLDVRLLKRLGEDGRLDPSQRTLAADSDCTDRTVRTALARMRALGLLRWQRRIVRAGWRSEQVSNAYELIQYSTSSQTCGEVPLPASGGSSRRETPLVLIQERPANEVRAAQAALADIRRRMEQRLLVGHARSGTRPQSPLRAC